MADKLEQMLEHLVNDEQEKAEELFHEYVVEKSREIYESLVEDDNDDEDDVEESFEVDEADGDMDDMDDMMGGDETDDLANDIEVNDEESEDDKEDDDEEAEELFQDLEDIVGELEAKFAELQGEESEEEAEDETEESFAFEADDEDEKDDEEVEESDDFEDELASLREYVEKVSGGAASSETTADNKKSVVDNMKNDMGGTAANILSDSTDEKGRPAPTAKEEDMGNVNVPGGKASKSMSKASGGADSSEKNADNTDSVLRSQR